MLKVNQYDYAYPTGRIRAREIKLLDESRFERMLGASSAEEAYKVLTEADYGFGGDTAGDFHSFETLLADELKKTFMLLNELAPQPGVVKAFQRRYDFFNIKVLLKAELQGMETPSILVETGNFEKDEIIRIIRDRFYEELTPDMRDTIHNVYDVFSRTRDPQVIDLLLDKASFSQFASDLLNIDNAFLQSIAKLTIDITNLKMFVRARAINKTTDFLKKILLEGGEIPAELYLDNAEKPVEVLTEALRETRYRDVVKKGLDLYKEKGNLSSLEKLLDNFFMEFLYQAKLITVGVEPFVVYLYAKETEIRNVRIIMTGKINNLPVDLIRERLRLGYV
jgi:V/A-type H+-transporting ATPase subunit C